MKTFLFLLLTTVAGTLVPSLMSGPHASGQPTFMSEWVLIKQALNNPYRKTNGHIVDLTPYFVWYTNETYACPMPEWRPIIGKITSVGKDGLIIALFHRGDGSTIDDVDFRISPGIDKIWLRNYPLHTTAVDGDAVCVIAREDGRQQYHSPVGAVVTVPAYDYGAPLTSAERDHIKDTLRAREAALRAEQIAAARTNAHQKQLARHAVAAETDRKVLERQQQRAAAGSAQAQYDLALRCLTGDGVATNIDEARRLLTLSAAQNFPLAQHKLRSLTNINTGLQPGATNRPNPTNGFNRFE